MLRRASWTLFGYNSGAGEQEATCCFLLLACVTHTQRRELLGLAYEVIITAQQQRAGGWKLCMVALLLSFSTVSSSMAIGAQVPGAQRGPAQRAMGNSACNKPDKGLLPQTVHEYLARSAGLRIVPQAYCNFLISTLCAQPIHEYMAQAS